MSFVPASVIPGFFSELVALLVAGAALAYVCHRLGVTPIVSFLVTGALVGPHAFGLVHDESLIEGAAELGVVLLLFTIGIEFSLEKLGRIKRLILVGGGVQVVLTIALVTGVLAILGVAWPSGVFTGCLVALSSTAIVMKLLMGSGDMGSEEGQAALGILIFQDLAVVGMVLLVPMLAGAGHTGVGIVVALGKALGIVVLVLVISRRVMPRLLEAVARTCSQEIFLLSVVSICLGTAYLTSLAGVSLSLGAFLAGLIVSESRFSQLAVGEILPLQILFSATFFVSVGLLLDLSYLVQHPLLVLGIILAVLVVKLLTTGAGLLALGYRFAPAATTALLLAQVGEFSFVLARSGRDVGLYPAGMASGGPESFIGATVALMIATPFLAQLGDRLRPRGGATAPAQREDEPGTEAESGPAPPVDPGLEDHVIIAGFGPVGRTVAQILDTRRIPYVIVTLSPDGALQAEHGELRVLRGNYTRQHELKVTGIHSARLLVVADDDFETTLRVVTAARALHAEVQLIARCGSASQARALRAAGADVAVADEAEGALALVARVLEARHVSEEQIREYQEELRQSPDQGERRPTRGRAAAPSSSSVGRTVVLTQTEQQSAHCSHVAGLTAVTVSADGCEECLETGDAWVHLRVCMSCGHVGCCDTSRNKHATKHAASTGHPVIKSLEPGESWAWCYEDARFL